MDLQFVRFAFDLTTVSTKAKNNIDWSGKIYIRNINELILILKESYARSLTERDIFLWWEYFNKINLISFSMEKMI